MLTLIHHTRGPIIMSPFLRDGRLRKSCFPTFCFHCYFLFNLKISCSFWGLCNIFGWIITWGHGMEFSPQWFQKDGIHVSGLWNITIYLEHTRTQKVFGHFWTCVSPLKKLCVTSKVVIATNMAESSLTVPNVGAVVDFGMHRVNEYDDEERTFVCYGCFLFKNWRSWI